MSEFEEQSDPPFERRAGLGATGEFPYGKSRPDDEGELRAAIAADRRTETVFIDFGKPISWLSMRPEHAEKLAQTLMAKAKEARR